MRSGGKDKEVKTKKRPGRVPTACAECRRLKLRCDRSVPCAKCVSRGCDSICPNGSLAPGQGNRMVLAGTEQLHEEIAQLRSRNRDLETALRTLQETVTDQTHPLLRSNSPRSLLRLDPCSSSGPSNSASSKSPTTSRISPATQPPEPVELPLEDDANIINIFGTLVVGQREGTRFIGKTARPETLCFPHPSPKSNLPKVPQSLLDLAFPEPPHANFVSDVLDLLPSFAEAFRLCGVYFEYGKFLYSPLSRKELLDETLDSVYQPKTSDSVQKSHGISLLFIVFAIATLLDPDASTFSLKSQEYYVLSRASLNLAPGGSEVSLTLVQIHAHIAHYLDLSDSGTETPDAAWIQVGEAVQLAHRMGLHINASHWNLPSEPIKRRDQVYWSLFVLDAWASFHVGRPPHIARRHLDQPPLTDTGELASSDGHLDGGLHTWNIEFSLSLVSIMEALGPKPPVYTSILDLDRKVRDVYVPANWRMPSDNETSLPLSTYISRWSTLSRKEIVLLNLHRPYFMQALQDSPGDLQRHRYLPSVVSAYRSGWRLIRALAMTWAVAPEFLSRMSIAWSYAFSAGIVMCLYVTQAPTSYLTPAALGMLDRLVSLFNSASPTCRPADKLLPSIKSLHQKAHETMGSPHMRYHQHNNLISSAELERLAGKTHLIVDPSSSRTSIPSTEQHSAISRSTSVTMSDIAEHQPAVYHPTENLHPTVAHDLREFARRNSNFTSAMLFYDHPSEFMPPVNTPPLRLSPRPWRETHSEPFKNYHQPVQTRMESHYFQYPHLQETILEPRRTTFGGGFGQGFGGGGWNATSLTQLDPSWNSFVEQLGF